MIFIRLFSVTTLLLVINSFAIIRYGVPSQIHISAYAINDYSTFPGGATNLNRTILHKNMFINQIQVRLAAKYPSVDFYITHNRENSSATVYNFLNDDAGHIIFFSGHGTNNSIALRNGLINSYSGKKFDGWTRWVYFDACLTLNANLSQVANWFDGTHAILGYRSLSWEFSGSPVSSEDVLKEFATRFITNGETIWNAHKNSVISIIYNQAGIGIEPAIVNRIGNAEHGEYVDFADEQFSNTYNGPFNTALYATNIATSSRSVVYGVPQY